MECPSFHFLWCTYSNVSDNRNKFLIANVLKQGYRYHKIYTTFSKFYHRYYELIAKYINGLKTILQQGTLQLVCFGDLVYRFKRIVGQPNLSVQLKKMILRYKNGCHATVCMPG